MGFDIVSFGFISYHVYSLGLELLFILSILLLYTTVLCFSLYPYFIINVHKLTWDCAAYINIEGSLQVMYDATGVGLRFGLQAEVRLYIFSRVLWLYIVSRAVYSLYCLSNKQREIQYILLDIFGLYQYQSCLSLDLCILFLSVCIMAPCGFSFRCQYSAISKQTVRYLQTIVDDSSSSIHANLVL